MLQLSYTKTVTNEIFFSFLFDYITGFHVMLSGNTNPLQMQYGKYILGHVHLGRAFLGIAPRSS